jgi:regulator of protease activity HflC (stomatin/prohibitin superfamily)
MNVTNLFQILAGVGWIAAIIVIILIVTSAARARPFRLGSTMIAFSVILALVFTALSAGAVYIRPEERGVVLSVVSPRGYREEALQPGLRWVIPFLESVQTFPVSRQTYTMSVVTNEGQVQGDDSIAARTFDGQEIFVDASVIYNVDPTKVVQVYILWQGRYTEELVRPLARGVIRDAVSQFGVQDVVSSKRFEMVKQMRDAMEKKLNENGLQMVDFVLRNITFSKEYASSVEQKQIAEQQAQQAKFVVETKKQEAEQARQVAQGQADAVVISAKSAAQSRLIQADAEAKSLQMLAEVLKNNPEMLTYQYITKISPNVQVMFLPSNAPFVFPLPNMSTLPGPQSPTQPTPEPTKVPTP